MARYGEARNREQARRNIRAARAAAANFFADADESRACRGSLCGRRNIDRPREL